MTGFNSKRAMAADKLQEQCQKHGECFGGECIYPPVQEPVAWMCSAFDGEPCEQTNHDECGNPIPLYTTPPQREWVGLTPEETSGFTQHEMTVVKYVSKVLQEKNT